MRRPIAFLLFLCGTTLAVNAADWIADQRTGCRLWNNYPADGESIEWNGPCINGMGDGRGVLRWFSANGNFETAEGEFRDGKLNGHAVITDTSGRFEGQFRNNKPNGYGTYRNTAGEVFSGDWTNGCFAQGNRRAYFFTTQQECGFDA